MGIQYLILICNLIKGNKGLVQKFDKISFVYCKRSTNKVIDRIVKETSYTCITNLLFLGYFITCHPLHFCLVEDYQKKHKEFIRT